MSANGSSTLQLLTKTVETDVDIFDLDLRFSPQQGYVHPMMGSSSYGEYGPSYCPDCPPTCAGNTCSATCAGENTCYGTCTVPGTGC